MATKYVDFEGGNDANDGSSFANRVKTITSGITAARVAPGDVVRIMASPPAYQPVGITASWVNNSANITLNTALTRTIDNMENAYTSANANVTCSTATVSSLLKQGTRCTTFAIGTAFTTGKVAYRTLPAPLDLSAFQQISFWVNVSSGSLPAGSLQIRLCSDTAGDVAVDTLTTSALQGIGTAVYRLVLNKGSALGSNINSVAIHCVSDPTPTGTITIQMDNLIACKAAGSTDELTHCTLISKPYRTRWAPSTAYSLNDIRIPRPALQSIYAYKATAVSGAGVSGASEPTWPKIIGNTVVDGDVTWENIGIREQYYTACYIDGTDIRLDISAESKVDELGIYPGTTETCALNLRQTLNPLSVVGQTINESGTSVAPVTYSGGWDRTNMSTQNDETWIARNRIGSDDGISGDYDYLNIENLNFLGFNHVKDISNTVVRCSRIEAVGMNRGFKTDTLSYFCDIEDTMINGTDSNSIEIVGEGNELNHVVCDRSLFSSIYFSSTSFSAFCPKLDNIFVRGSLSAAVYPAGGAAEYVFRNLTMAYNNSGFYLGQSGSNLKVFNLNKENMSNVLAVWDNGDFHNPILKIIGFSTDRRINTWYSDAAWAEMVTDQRHTASGYAWKFSINNTTRFKAYAFELPVARIAVKANEAVSVRTWMRRNLATIQGELVIKAWQIPGVEEEIAVSYGPSSLNTWELGDPLTFTPTANGVVEITFRVWDGVGTTGNFWIDDLTVT